MAAVNCSNAESFRSGTLMRVFDEIDEFTSVDPQQVVEAVELQTKVTQVLEARGYTYDEELDEWVYNL